MNNSTKSYQLREILSKTSRSIFGIWPMAVGRVGFVHNPLGWLSSRSPRLSGDNTKTYIGMRILYSQYDSYTT